MRTNQRTSGASDSGFEVFYIVQVPDGFRPGMIRKKQGFAQAQLLSNLSNLGMLGTAACPVEIMYVSAVISAGMVGVDLSVFIQRLTDVFSRISGMQDPTRIIRTFQKTLNLGDPDFQITYVNEKPDHGSYIAIRTISTVFGYFELSADLESTHPAVVPLFRCAVQYLAIVLAELGNDILSDDELGVREVVSSNIRVSSDLQKSEERFRRLMDNSPDMLYRMSLPDGSYKFVSRQAEVITGYTPEEFYSDPVLIQKLFHPDWHDYFVEQWTRLIDGIAPETYEYQIIRKNGDVRWVHQRNTLITDTEGRPVEIEGVVTDFTARKEMEIALQESEEKYRLLFNSTEAFVSVYNRDGVCLLMNPAVSRLFGGQPEDFVGKSIRELHPEAADLYFRRITDVIETGTILSFEDEVQFPEGSRWLMSTVHPVPDAEGTYYAAQIISQDVTEARRSAEEKRKLERMLEETHKLESIGRLAGGIAHDFNNMLSAILGNVELVISDLDPSEDRYHDLKEIETAAMRAAELTRQLLGFARKQAVKPEIIDLDDKVADDLKMLERLIGENIDLKWQPSGRELRIKIDPSQIDQILTNLVVNSRDAIGEVGTIMIRTDMIEIPSDRGLIPGLSSNRGRGRFSFGHDAEPGMYVVLDIRDTGTGMSPETLEHLFDPFYTTKPPGAGTGLGLATVYGIVRQNGGFINVESKIGDGTRIRIFLPRTWSLLQTEGRKAAGDAPKRGSETILFVEDEPSILQLGRKILERLGYQVLTAGQPEAALDLASRHDGLIDLLITDVIMPEMNGKELSERLLEYFPGMRHLYMSGYSADIISSNGVMDSGTHFLQKPFSSVSLSLKVREAIETN